MLITEKDFDQKELIKAFKGKIKECKNNIADLFAEKRRWKKKLYNTNDDQKDWFFEMCIEDTEQEIKKERSKLYSWDIRLRKVQGKKIPKQAFDLEAIKEVPISYVLSRSPQMESYEKDFYLSPFRDEKNASFVYYKKTNTWYDFGSGEGGDVISLYCKLYNIDFKNACYELNKII